MRRESDLVQTNTDLNLYNTNLQQIGLSIEYYQTLRNDITIWVNYF